MHPLAPMTAAKWRELLLAWGLALLISGGLVWSGSHWPTPLLQQSWALAEPGRAAALALVLVLGLPALMALVLGLRMLRHRDKGESIDCAQGER
ncbi:MAG: hypothetical protein RLZZ32_749 [Cyanobacteriota bacterium]|jgi:hypothetical protein